VSIPIRVVNGKIEGFGRELPVLADCVGDLIVPGFAVGNPADLEWLTRTDVRMLFEAGTPLLFRLSGRQIPPELKARCRAEVVPDSASPGAFVEVMLEEPLHLWSMETRALVEVH
jgi:hypothetical protein